MSEDPNRSLIWAVRNGDIETAERLIDTYGLSYLPGWSSGYILLREALENGQEIMAKMLLNRGSRVNDKNQNLTITQLHLAVQTGYTEIVGMLLDKQANIDARDSDSRTPLFCAVLRGSLELVTLLLDRGADVHASTSNGSSPLSTAVKTDKLAIAEELLRRGADANTRDAWTPLDSKYRGVVEPTPLYLAVTRNNLPMIELLLKMGADVNGTSGDWNETPLHAAMERSDEVVGLLLDKGANVNATGRDDETPLHAAIRHRSEVKVKLLLAMGADVDASTKDGATALRVAVKIAERSAIVEEILRFRPDVKSEANRGSLAVAIKAHTGDESRETVDALLRYGFKVRAEDADDVELFHAAVEGGHRAIIESLLKLGADVNAPLGSSGQGETPLHAAIRCRRFEVAELLLSHGANANAEDEVGRSVMLLAVEMGVASVVKSLLLRSDASSRDIEFLVFAAVEEGDPEIVEALLGSAPRMDVEARDMSGRTPLLRVVTGNPHQDSFERETGEWCAKSLAKAKIAEMLLNRGASVNTKTNCGKTTLHLAAKEGCADAVKVLLENKAHVDCLSDYGSTPLHIAVKHGKTTTAKVLLDHGANVNARTKLGTTALHCASGKGHAELVKLLLQRGADPDSEDPEKRSPLHYAVMKCNSDAVGVLLTHGSNVTFENLMTLLDYAKSQNEKFRHHYIRGRICPWLGVAETLERHIIAMKALECHANDWNLPGFDMEHERDSYLRRCRREIEKMKSKSIGGRNVSVHDVLTRDMNQLAVYARNESIAQALACEDLADEFPTYYGMAARRFQQGLKRVTLLSSGAKAFNALTGYVMPDLAIEILKHLSNDDLEKVIEACPVGDDCDSYTVKKSS